MPLTIGVVVSQGMATLSELQTVYGLEDLFDLLEIIQVDDYNTRLLTKTA